jgi:hypothetical protein
MLGFGGGPADTAWHGTVPFTRVVGRIYDADATARAQPGHVLLCSP